MAPAYSCLRCGYATDSVGNYNKHINKYSKCKPKEIEERLLCAKQCKVGGSTLRKHVCLADKSLEHFEMQYVLFDAVCLELKSMPDNDFQQLGLASHQPEDVALAAFELLYPKAPAVSKYCTMPIHQQQALNCLTNQARAKRRQQGRHLDRFVVRVFKG